MRIDDVTDDVGLPFEFEDRTDPRVARELATNLALTKWAQAQRAAGHAPN